VAHTFDPNAKAGQGGGFRVVPIGVHLFRLTAAKFGDNANGDPQVKLTAKVVASNVPGAVGMEFRDVFGLTPEREGLFADLCLKLGQAEAFDLENPAELKRALVGRVVWIKVKHTTKPKHDGGGTITFANRDGWEDAITAASPAHREEFEERQGGTISPGGLPGDGGGPSGAAPGGGPGDDDEDLPF